MNKKMLLSAAVVTALASITPAQAQDKEYDKWVAGSVEYYSTDSAERGSPFYLNNGSGFGVEAGIKLTPFWGARLELSHLDINALPDSISTNRVGVDAMYFMSDDSMYVFGGVKHISIGQNNIMANVGVGKHWNVSESFKVITEIAGYQELSNDNNTHVGLKLGLAYAFGQSKAPVVKAPVDSDNDGVFDAQDNCPATPFGSKVDASGCSLDADNDGVLNSLDKCPNTPAGTKVGAKGCSLVLDTDQDGVLDDQDQCADTPMTDKVDANGCSVFTEKLVSVDLQVTFANNSAEIRNPGDSQFQEFADFMARFPGTDTVIEGHASAPGDADYNMALSLKRANAVKALLVNTYGIDAVRLTTKGFGETQLLDHSNTAAAHKVNRRITAKVSASKREKVAR
ncbi:OmpA family protein [Paraglaciecola aestuariivivens]